MRNKGNSSDPRFYNPNSAAQLLAQQLMKQGSGQINDVGDGIRSAAGSLAGAYVQRKSDESNAQAQKDYGDELTRVRAENPDGGDALLKAMMESPNAYVKQDANDLYQKQFAEQLAPEKPTSVSAGSSLVDPKTGKVIFQAPNAPLAGSGGGQIGYIYDKIKKEHPDWSDTQIIYAAQTGMRQGLMQNADGSVAPMAGVPDAKSALKYAETSGGNQSDLQYKPQITAANKVAERQGEAQGNLNYDEAAMPQLEDTVAKLSDLGKKATYTLAGQGRDIAVRQAGMGATDGAVAREAYSNTVRNQILPLLRQTFGAQFTKAEGDKLEETLGDINKSSPEKDAALQAFIEQKKANIATSRRMTGQQPSAETAPVNYKSKYGLN